MSGSPFRGNRNRRTYGTGRVTTSVRQIQTHQDGRQLDDVRSRNNSEQRRFQPGNQYHGNEMPMNTYNASRYNQSKRRGHMGFKYVQSLLENHDLEFILVTLNNDKKGFKELLGSVFMTNDMIVLLVKLLSKICGSSFPESKIHTLLMTLESAFVDNLTKFISAIAIQDGREKNSSKYFWNDPEEFWNNIINICKNIHDLIPLTACEKTLKILTAIKVYTPLIESRHQMQISNEVKEKTENLHTVLQEEFHEFQRKHKQNEIIKQPINLQPPDDFRQISIYPTLKEITTLEKPFLRPNIIDGPYQNANHYLDVQFRLLREDFVAPLRKGICNHLNNSKERLEDIRIYFPVQFLKTETINEQNCYRIQFDFTKKKKSYLYEHSRRFLFGSLLCFTSNNFKSIIFGKIVQRDTKDLDQGHLIIGFNENVKLPRNLFERKYLMVESKIYFEPYYHVLNVLKTMNTENFPMESYIIKIETKTNPPDYLLKIDPIFYEIEGHTFWPLNWIGRNFYDLNDSQYKAFKAALTNEFAIIQGPPGTGKTFLGLKIAHTLIKNKTAWYKKTPMLVICFTNHALDQFLEGLLPVTQNIIRVGGQSKNPNLKDFNIRNKRFLSNETVNQMWHRVRSHLQKITDIDETLYQISLNNSIFNFSIFSEVIPEYKNSWFANSTHEAIKNWLFGAQEHFVQVHSNHAVANQAEESLNLDNIEIEDYYNEDLNPDQSESIDDVFDNITFTFIPWISVKGLYENINILKTELNSLQANHSIQRLKEERMIYELNYLERNCRYLQQRLTDASNGLFRGKPDFIDLQNPSYMSSKSRWHLYFYWLEQYKFKLLEEREIVYRHFRADYKLYNENREIQDTQIMKESLVVGMTTTAAARLKSSLQALKSPIVIVEEAAEVLEAHIITALTNSCKHLILIGDHQQLKPSTANFTVETKYLLGISLFERMVKNNLQCYKLNVQHRMRPEIACLIRPAIYPVLEDHESVQNRAPIRGLENCLYFIDHQEPEQLCKDSSKKNVHEAAFLIKFAKHLVLNGHEPERITILATYLGQMFEMLHQRKNDVLLKDVKITVLDNYQGEENDIILLSLVRSNNDNKIGFLKIENRVCVALSRAKNGFYMIGNMTQLSNNSDIWMKVKETLESQNAIGPSLSLRCQVHREQLTSVKTADDFLNIPEGGCNLMCETHLGCGHTCKSLCHVKDRDHILYKCLEKCNRILCNNEEHICTKLCYEECGMCWYPVQHDLDCGHRVTIECHINPATYNCNVQVKSVLPCGHEVKKPCFMDPKNVTCPEPCAVRVDPCGHACTKTCHIKDDPDHLQYLCRKPCARRKVGCRLPDDDVPDEEKHLCSKFCFEECEGCEVGVKKFRTICPHVYTVACKFNVDEIDCKKPCTNKLPCGHVCKNRCNEPCGNCSIKVKKMVPECGHEIMIECSKDPDRKYCKGKCPRLLACGHKCDKKCCDECTTICKADVICSLPSPCGHIVKKIRCALKNTNDLNILLRHCTEKCNTQLKCSHICPGRCGDCSQGRFHEKCKEKCLNTLICNHECPIPCSQACKPCQKNCSYKCRHNKCSRKCGDPCNPCKEPCGRKCEHRKCKKQCGQICNVPPCYQPCKRMLKCGHPCVGFCGDPCPILCRTCDHDELTEIFLGNEDEENARYVMLEDCKHIFECKDIEKWLQSTREILAKFCPKCKMAILSTERFSEFIKRNMIDVINIKKKSYGVTNENHLQRLEILDEVEDLKIEIRELFEDTLLPNVLENLNQKLQKSKGKGKNARRQTVNKIDLDVVNAKLQLVHLIINVCGKKKNHIIPTGKSAVQLSFIIKALMRDENYITEQEIEDITLEIERLSRLVQFEKIQNESNFHYTIKTKKLEGKIVYIEELLTSPKRYIKETDSILQEELTTLCKLVASPIAVTEVEKRAIVAAIGLKRGHWFKCPNGHYYVIADCGGANQISTCNECGQKIGGTRHQLLPGQSHAPEMDESNYPAWSEAANLANYQF